jgi:hypothetical protein
MTNLTPIELAVRDLDEAIALGHREALPRLRRSFDVAVAEAMDRCHDEERAELVAAWQRVDALLEGRPAGPARRSCPWRERHG